MGLPLDQPLCGAVCEPVVQGLDEGQGLRSLDLRHTLDRLGVRQLDGGGAASVKIASPTLSHRHLLETRPSPISAIEPA